VSLSITFGGLDTPARHWTLRCDPPGGTSPDPAAACSRLLADKNIFENTPVRRVMCPMIMTTAKSFTITGVYFGRRIRETLVDGGCDLARWSSVNHIFN
jgi:hypothetical protein